MMNNIKEESLERLTNSDIIDVKNEQQSNAPQQRTLQQQLSIDQYFQKYSNQMNNMNSTSQDKLIKSRSGAAVGKKRKTNGSELDVKKRNTPPPLVQPNQKKPSSEHNSDDSNPLQTTIQQNEKDNKKITNFFPKVKNISSKGREVEPKEKENDKKVPNGTEDKEDLQKEINQLRQRLIEKDLSEKTLSQEIKRLTQELQKDIAKNDAYKRNVHQAVIPILLKNEEQRRQIMKIQIENEKFRLGEFVQKRESVRFIEEWEEGYEIKQVREDLRQKEAEREELERQKREIKTVGKRIKSEALDNNSNSQNILFSDTDGQQKKERISFQISILSKEENELRNKLKGLEEERNMFLHKLKKFNDEIKQSGYLISCRFAKVQGEGKIQEWPLFENRYQLLSLLGKGGFSEVYKAFDLKDLRMTACKIHHFSTHWSEQCKGNYIKHALRETEIHQTLEHPNIVKLYDTIEINSDSFCTVLEYCDGYDLNYHLKKYKCFSEKEAKIIIRQILNALDYFSKKHEKIIHYDLKPQNILFHRGEVKISDFGLSKQLDHGQTRMELTSQGLGTYWYLPPECFITSEQPPQISTKVDVWSVGVILYEMIYGQKPFGQGMSQEKIAKEQIILKSTSVNFPQKTGISNECKDFIKKCLTYNMDARWDVRDAYNSPYIQSSK